MPALRQSRILPDGGTRLAELAEALVSAATELAASSEVSVLQPTGTPIRSGGSTSPGPDGGSRSMVRSWSLSDLPPPDGGGPDQRPPDLASLTFRGEVNVDRRGRAVLVGRPYSGPTPGLCPVVGIGDCGCGDQCPGPRDKRR